MDRLQEILDCKEFRNISPVTDYQREKIQKLSSRYILFKNKDNKHGVCENCLSDVEFEKTIHKETIKCPCCGKIMKVEHTWRKKGCDYNLDWFVQGKAISKDIFVLRYFEAYQYRTYSKRISEEAREIFDFKTGKRFRVEYHYLNKKWDKGNYHYVEHNMCWTTRKAWCLNGKHLQSDKQLIRETSKIGALKYYDYASKIGTYFLLSDDYFGLLSAPVYEKMEKVGFKDLVEQDFGRGQIRWNPKATSLVKMLKLDKVRYKYFQENPTTVTLSFLQKYKNISEKEIKYVLENAGCRSERYSELRRLKVRKTIKAMEYAKRLREKSSILWVEYTDYLSNLKKLGYDMNDNSYLFPSDFCKEDHRVAEELVRRESELKAKKKAEKSAKIAAISEGLRKMDDLKDFLGGSNGLLVYVPEKAEELYEEGRLQHNCVGTYVDRIAEGKTMVFFIRKLNSPNEPFVTMEYCNGEVIQVRYDHNKTVDDTKIINFVDAFAERLRKNKVMVA